MQKYSSRREAVRRALRGTRTHPTAAEVYELVLQSMPGISLGTVYRNLAGLADVGEILRIHAGGGVERFDANTSGHYHLYCECCGRVSDVDMPEDDTLALRCEAEVGALVRRTAVVFYGVCPGCRERAI